MSRLIVASNLFKVTPGPESFRDGLSSLLRSLTPRSLGSLSDALRCSRRSLTMWRQGTTQPRIESLCSLCFRLGASPLDLISGENSSCSNVLTLNEALWVREIVPKPRKIKIRVPLPPVGCISLEIRRKAVKSEGEEQLRIALQDALTNNPPRSARSVAASIGYSSPDRVLKKFPNLCAALESRLKEHAMVHECNTRRCLENALLQSPPPTLKYLAKKFKMSSSSALRTREPVLCHRLLALRKTWRRKNE